MAYTQKNRPISIETALGDDKLLLRKFILEEKLNTPFSVTADVLCEDADLDFNALVGKPVTIQMSAENGKSKRFVHGYVDRIVQKEKTGKLFAYDLELVPWLAFLDKTSDCRIFQKMSVPDIIQKVFNDAGFSDFDVSGLTETYTAVEYCVQYRETSFNFVSRLMENEGIAYYFKHTKDKHVLVLTDTVASHKPFPGYSEILYRDTNTDRDLLESIHHWNICESAKTGTFVHTDFDFKQVTVDLTNKATKPREHGLAQLERFDYPGTYVEAADGKRLATVRLQELQAGHKTATADAICRGLSAGFTFSLKNHPRKDQNKEYLVTETKLTYEAGEFATTKGSESDKASFKCTFTTLGVDEQFRPERITPEPRIVGPQTAIVTGPTGEEIHTEEHGRVTVQFHWDRYGKRDENSSCWVRVSQNWAGKGWGAMHIPRIGQEVIVEHLEGNPDRPIITGRVYNGDNRSPYELPDKKNISGLRSNSTKGGQPETNFNEVLMDDTKGSELLAIQAEKDRTVLVKNDNTEDIKHDEAITVGNNRDKHVKKNETTNVDENRTETVGKNEDITIGANRTEEVKKNENITIGENRTEQVAKDEEVKIGKNRTHEVKEIDKLQVGKQLLVDVGDEIVFRTGKATLTMKKDGTITINGVDISALGKGEIVVKASKDLTLKGASVKGN